MKTTMQLSFFSDRYCEPGEGRIPVASIGFNRGYAAFDFLKVLAGRPFVADRHVERFFRTMRLLRLTIPQGPDEVRGIVEQLAAQGDGSAFGLKLFAVPTTSVETEVFSSELCIEPVVLPTYAREMFTVGSRLISFEYQRFLPEAKSTHYLPSVYWEPELRRRGALEPLFHWGGFALETARSNVFAVVNGEVVTPVDRVLKGVTRSLVLDAMRARSIAYAERPLSIGELMRADEVWVTSTTKGIAPIIAVDDQTIADGKIGPVCRQMMAAYQGLLENPPLSVGSGCD